MLRLITLVLSVFAFAPAALCIVSYDNDFVDPNYILSKSFNTSTAASQESIVQWADSLAAEGPWSVMNKSVNPPSGNKHDYLSWAPYWWPNCTGVGNTTELTPQQIWVTCPYYVRDGMFNPDGRLVDDVGNFSDMADAVLYNAMAWVLTGESKYSANTAYFVDTWFLNPATSMNPNLNFAQMQRGPGPSGQTGTHTGVLDLKGMVKVTTGILILRTANSPDWTSDFETQMNNWTTQYITWLQTSPIALEEAAATNNHGSYYFNQLSAVQILAGDTNGAKNTTATYFAGIYMNQIDASGEQPLEAVRTRPYHYRCYNLAAMITNARLGEFLGLDSLWNKTTTKGGTIKAALDFTMTVQPGDELASELYPNIAAVAANYGDPNDKYAAFLANADNTYPAQPYFLWDQPFTDSNLAAATPTANSQPTTTSNSHNGEFVSSHPSLMAASFMTLFLTCVLLVI
ncbi:hypothetical protein PILCRDRAFT_830320 [Piloderma croceum F 1598]|uniref:Alginate lyase domain-containing protein n=1 Tax=Piloderma croceum (strain F 1598) TaxID=765440 RepID=A0A0C3ACE3_PILCF|nr:hypothetical protein PILCRDRAFT_830320 [Piloderma croceum F 1598]